MVTAVKDLTLEEVTKEIGEITPVLKKAFAEAGKTLDMAKVEAFGAGLEDGQKSERMATMNVRLQELGERKLALTKADESRTLVEKMDEWLRAPSGGAPTPGTGRKAYVPFAELAMKDLGWVETKNRDVELDLDVKTWLDREVKTVMSTGAGFAPQAIRSGVVTFYPAQQPAVIDLIPIVPTSQNAYVFMRQTTRTNNAAEISESTNGSLQSLAESAFAYTQVSETVRKIGHYVPVTDEQLEDIDGIDSILNNDMLVGVRQRLSSQLMNGDGNAPNLTGFLDDGHTPTDVDTTGDFVADAIAKLIENVQVLGFTEPNAVIMHASDFWGYRRATTSTGIYIAGNPSDNTPPMLWGKPVLLTTEIAQGSAHCGNYADFARLAVKRGVTISRSTEHASYFIQGVQAIKAEMRAAFAIYRELAFAKTNDIVV
jgi:HK97 family phage major capsid protein